MTLQTKHHIFQLHLLKLKVHTTPVKSLAFLLYYFLGAAINYCSGTDIDVLYRNEVCDEREFYKPYVRLLRTRQPHHENFPILKLFTPGYLSVSRHSGILCINGPAIIYTDTVSVQCSKSQEPEWIPSSGDPQIFIHDCFSINRFPRDSYKQSNLQELTKESEVFGNKVFGVYLLGMPQDYRLPTFKFFPRPDYGYKSENSYCINNGASVAFVANNSESAVHCYTVKKYNVEGVLNLNFQGHESLFCYREDQEDEFDNVWRKAKPVVAEDVVWESGSNNCNPSLLPPQVEFDQEPIQLPDFRMIHPRFWSSQGSSAVVVKKKKSQTETDEASIYSKPNPPGSLFAGEPGWKAWADGQGAAEGVTEEPRQKFQVDLSASDCEEIPPVPHESVCNDEIIGSCEILQHILTLTETDWRSEDMEGGSWRLSILNMVTDIYETTCPQIARFLPSALSRLYQYFLHKSLLEDSSLKEKFNGAQHQDWTELTKELEQCHEKATMMNFFKKRDRPAIKLRKKLEQKLAALHKRVTFRLEAAYKQTKPGGDDRDPLAGDSTLPGSSYGLDTNPDHLYDLGEIEKVESHLREIPLKFPYTILIGTPTSTDYSGASKVYQYREAAEVDHELDWALDAFWKVISTVLGYCHLHFTKRDANSYELMYQAFSRDFLAFIEKDWIKGDNRVIYEHLFGEFMHGGGLLWLDACQNGAYQWSDIADLRPLRPLNIQDGETPSPLHTISSNSGSEPPSHTNFFLDNPSFAASDHYDYYDEKGSDIGDIDETPVQYHLAESLRHLDDERKLAIAEAVVNLHTDNNENDVPSANVV